MAPDDPYPVYNRGGTRLALGMIDEARADFETFAGPKTRQTMARKPAREALASLPVARGEE